MTSFKKSSQQSAARRPESLADFANMLNRAMIHQLVKVTVCIAAIPAGEQELLAEKQEKNKK